MDLERVKAVGPWVFVVAEKPKTLLESGLYIPDGNLMQRLGHSAARVISAGKGYWKKDKDLTKKARYVTVDLKPGDRVVFRGHLQDANKFDDGCFIHVHDIVGTLEEDVELTPAYPHGN